MAGWRFEYIPSLTLPPLAWVARVRKDVVEVDCGQSVRYEADGFFEGTWVGASEIGSILDSTSPFGTGMVARGTDLFAIPPGHTTALLFSWRDGDELLIANTFVGLLAKGGLELLPDVDYSSMFAQTAYGLASNPTELPTSRGPAQFHLFENQRVLAGGRLELSPKPREKPFRDFGDYLARLDAALASALANAPGYPMVIALSRGYDSPTVATLAARHGLHAALTFKESRPPRYTRDPSDSGEDIARKLGLSIEFFDRTAYTRRDDLPEAEFLATGYTGEEVTYVAMADAVRHKMMLTGGLAGWMWLKKQNPQVNLERKDFSACSVTEFRLRLDMIDLPLPMFGMTQIASVNAISNSAEMRPWSVGGYYDKPIARRILEQAGFARGDFGTSKRASTALMHVYGEALMAPTSVASLRAFAAAEGRTIDLSPRRRPTRLDRGLIQLFRGLRMRRLAQPFAERQRMIVQHRPESGALLFRWGVANTAARYAELRPPS
ncbi:MAG: hypothetical protein ABI725_01800 [Chloroflexota bacterium]